MFELTQEYLKSILEYNPETGLFTYIKKTAHCVKIGTIAGGICNVYGINRRKIGIKNKVYLSSRLAFLYTNGKWPELVIDHINGIGTDDRWCNLREISQHDNMKNVLTKRKLPMGVYINTSGNYYSTIMLDKKSEYLGTYKTMEEARDIYLKRRHELMGEFSRV